MARNHEETGASTSQGRQISPAVAETLMKKPSKRERRKKTSPLAVRLVTWLVVIAGVVLVLYAISQNAGVAFDDKDIGVVSFSGLTSSEKKSALQAANRARCTCGCGMSLAQCVATDMSCPVRDRNIESVRAMVREADKS